MTTHLERPSTPGLADLTVFSDPRSVAVVGASADPAKWGYWLAAGALRGQHRRDVHLINSRAREVLGQPCWPSLADLPAPPELVALCVPAAHVSAVVEEGLRQGVRGFLGITAGVAHEAELARRITEHGARLVGTNSLGIYDAETDLQLMWGSMDPGPMAIVSQSGQLGSELAQLGNRRGIGVSRFVSIGNQSDVTAVEVLRGLAAHEPTRVVALYLESFAGGEALFDALAALRAAGKPTILLTVGASAAGARLARSHTGSLTAPSEIVDAACRRAGVIRAATPGELVDIAQMCLVGPAPRGRRLAIVGDSGGQCGVAADVAARLGIEVVPLSADLAAELAQRLPDAAAVGNPVDLAGAGERDLATYASVTETLANSGEVDAVLLSGYFGCYGRDIATMYDAEEAVVADLGRHARTSGLPVVVHTMGASTPMGAAMWHAGVPAYERVEAVLTSLAAMAVAAPDPLADAFDEGPAVMSTVPVGAGYWAARDVLTEIGARFPAGMVVHGPDEVAEAAKRLPFPVVLKASWLEHKSEAAGVVTNLAGPEALASAFADMHERLGAGDYVVEAQDTRAGVVEILVGARRDPGLGPIVVVGAGGTETEILADTSIEMAPVSRCTARTMLTRLRCGPMLSGWRGRPPVDVDALAGLISAVSHLIAQRSDVDEIELNPVRAGADGVVAVDALVVEHVPEPDAQHTETPTPEEKP